MGKKKIDIEQFKADGERLEREAPLPEPDNGTGANVAQSTKDSIAMSYEQPTAHHVNGNGNDSDRMSAARAARKANGTAKARTSFYVVIGTKQTNGSEADNVGKGDMLGNFKSLRSATKWIKASEQFLSRLYRGLSVLRCKPIKEEVA